MEQPRLTDPEMDCIEAYRQKVKRGWKDATLEDKWRILDALRVKVTVDGYNVSLSWEMATEPVTIDLETGEIIPERVTAMVASSMSK